jgi:hypothetical protein
MEWRINLAAVSRTLEALLSQGDRSVAMLDRTTGQACQVSPGLAAAPEGLLPVFLVAADTIWREATGRSFGVDLQRDPETLVGFHARGVSGGPFSSVMLSMMEAMAQVARPDMILVNDFDQLWRGIERDRAAEESAGRRYAPSFGGR